MDMSLSENAQAIVLLVAPLGTRGSGSARPLTQGEYKKLARRLYQLECRPADLLGAQAASLVAQCADLVEPGRLAALLARGFQLARMVDRWQKRGITVVSRADPEYPRRLRERLAADAPAVLYGCGSWRLPDSGGLAVVGSRHADEELCGYAADVGRLVAAAGRTLISGGARGIDLAAMEGSITGGGRTVGVLAHGLARVALDRRFRAAILEDRLLLVSPNAPEVSFHVGLAMQRNKLIYALADAALAVSADLGKGGTWAGAKEQLEKLHFVPVYVRAISVRSPGLDGLRESGALPWPEPRDARALARLLDAARDRGVAPDGGELFVREGRTPASSQPDAELLAVVRDILDDLLREPMTEEEIVEALGVTRSQAARWLKHLVAAGRLERKTRPIRYVGRLHGDEDAPAPLTSSPSARLHSAVRRTLLGLLRGPRTRDEIVEAMDVAPRQADAWLRLLLEEGLLERRRRPVSYVVRHSLFPPEPVA